MSEPYDQGSRQRRTGLNFIHDGILASEPVLDRLLVSAGGGARLGFLPLAGLLLLATQAEQQDDHDGSEDVPL